MKPCIFFQQRRCTRGNSCLFSHDMPVISTPDFDRLSLGRDNANSSSREPLTGSWRAPSSTQKGTLRASAPTFRSARESTEPSPQSPQDLRNTVPCKYYLLDSCRNSQNCPYAHPHQAERPDLFLQDNKHLKLDIDEDTTELRCEKQQTDFSGYFCGAFAQFEAGAQVSKITLPSDTSSIRINGLPPDSTSTSVSALLASRNFDFPPESIQISRIAGATTSNADIRANDPASAKRLCANIGFVQHLDKKYSKLEAIFIPCVAYPGPNSRRISRRKVHISWHKPVCKVQLGFGREDVASRVCAKFSNGVYKVRGSKVTARAPPEHAHRRSHLDYSVSWIVSLGDVPYEATEEDVSQSIYLSLDKPRHIEVRQPSSSFDSTLANTFVESSFTDLGSVEFRMSDEQQGKRFKACARFEDEERALEAVRLLHDRSQDYLDHGKLTVQLVSSAKFKIKTTIYDVLIDQISEQHHKWGKRYLRFRAYRNTDQRQCFTTLSIEGEQANEVANASTELEKIVTGRRIEDGGNPIWSEALGADRILFHELKQIQQRHKVMLIRDNLKKELRFFGRPDRYTAVLSAVVGLLKSRSRAANAIHLEPDQFSWACTGGFKQITAVLGDDVASFDVVSRPRRILISGTKAQYQTALRLVHESKPDARDAIETDTDQACSICWTEADNPILTSCGHLYCLDCFESLSLSKSPEDKEHALCCIGNMGNCDSIFSLQELHDHISSATFEKMLENSFSSHIRRHPQTFRYCPTADCGYIYRTSSVSGNHTCIGCLEVVCTGCHEQHSLVTCAQHKDLKSGGYDALRKFKQENGIKDCPTCTTPLEKTDGCDHMTCRGCGTHICWVCLKTFETSGPCYAHMTAAHGGIGLDHLLGL